MINKVARGFGLQINDEMKIIQSNYNLPIN